MSTTKRPLVLVIRLSRDEHKWLEELAQERGITMSDVLRLEIRRQHAEMKQNKNTK